MADLYPLTHDPFTDHPPSYTSHPKADEKDDSSGGVHASTTFIATATTITTVPADPSHHATIIGGDVFSPMQPTTSAANALIVNGSLMRVTVGLLLWWWAGCAFWRWTKLSLQLADAGELFYFSGLKQTGRQQAAGRQ